MAVCSLPMDIIWNIRMASSIDCIPHGLHNVEVCEYLALRNEFSDWVITTAFYASLHLISSIIFPLEVQQPDGSMKTFNNVDDYKRSKGRSSPDKHTLICNIVSQKCQSEIASKYKWLYDTCRTARYVNYQQLPESAACAKTRMLAIKDYVLRQQQTGNKKSSKT